MTDTWDRFMAAIHGGNPDEALAILEREGHLMPERKIEAEAIAKKAKKPKVKIDHNRLMQMAMDDNCEGFCLACGAENFGIESDGGKGECEICGEHKVYGAARILGIV